MSAKGAGNGICRARLEIHTEVLYRALETVEDTVIIQLAGFFTFFHLSCIKIEVVANVTEAGEDSCVSIQRCFMETFGGYSTEFEA